MQLKEFKTKTKELAQTFGLKLSDVSIKKDGGWLKVALKNCIHMSNTEMNLLHNQIEELASLENKSDVSTDYFDYSTKIEDGCYGTFSSILITFP